MPWMLERSAVWPVHSPGSHARLREIQPSRAVHRVPLSGSFPALGLTRAGGYFEPVWCVLPAVSALAGGYYNLAQLGYLIVGRMVRPCYWVLEYRVGFILNAKHAIVHAFSRTGGYCHEIFQTITKNFSFLFCL